MITVDTFRAAIRSRGVQMKMVAEHLGVSVNTLYAWFRRGAVPSGYQVPLARFLELGDVGASKASRNASGRPAYAPTNPDEVMRQLYDALYDQVLIPEFDVALAAGQGSYPENHILRIGNRPFSRAWLNKKGLREQNLSLVRVEGDSMEPILKDKDIVMVDKSRTHPHDATPFAVQWDNALYVKLVRSLGNGRYDLTSVNKHYDAIEIDARAMPDLFKIIGAVVWHSHSWV